MAQHVGAAWGVLPSGGERTSPKVGINRDKV